MQGKSDHDMIVEMHSVLLGTNGQGGLCRKVENHSKSIFKIWIILVVLTAGSGGGIYGLCRVLLGG